MTLTILLTAGLCLAAQPPQDDPVKAELKLLGGTWVGVTGSNGDRRLTGADAEKLSLVIKGDRFTASSGDAVIMEGLVSIDPAKTPKTIDLASTKGRHEGSTVEGIYAVDPQELRLCLVEPGKNRPTAFAAPKGGVMLTYLRRK
jgi:uncharacterized protein (TIGR03067 family)